MTSPRSPTALYSYNMRSPLTTPTSQSGCTTPITSYGSFPPRNSPTLHPLSTSSGTTSDELSAKLLKSLKLNSGRDKYGRLKGKGKELLERESGNENESLFSRAVEEGGEMIEGSVDTGHSHLGRENLIEQRGRSRNTSERHRGPEDEIGVSTNFIRMRRSSKSRSSESSDTVEVKQWGVIKMELMSRTWGKGLITIFAGVYLISTLTSLEYNTTATIEPYFLSLLQSHSSLGAVYIVQNIVFAVGKPPMAKFLDVFGRAEGFVLAASLYSLGFLLTASSTSATSFIISRAIAALGGQGLQLASQVLIADTTTLTNRGLLTSTISLPWLVTTWIGPPLGQFFESRGEKGMRVGYGLFGVLLPLAASVLIGTLMLEWRKVKSLVSSPHSASIKSRSRRSSSNREIIGDKFLDLKIELEAGRDRTLGRKMGKLWKELDIVGLITLTLSCGLILLPLSLAARRPASWLDPMIWSLISLGICIFTFFVYYEMKISSIPLLPSRLLRNRTIICGSILGLFHFLSQACYETFFTSFLQVARNHSPSSAAYIAQSYMFSASIFAIVAGLGSKFTNRYKWIGIAGVLIHMIGTLLMSRARRLDTSTFEVVMSQVVGGIGGGLTTIAAQIGVQSVSTHQDVAIATAVFLTITQIGGAIGASVAGSVWSTLLPSRLRFHLPIESHHLIDEVVSSLTSALSHPVDSPIRLAIDAAYVDVQTRLNLLAIVLLFPALIAVCLMRDVHLDERELEDESKILILVDDVEIIDEEEIIGSSSESSSLMG